MSFGELLTAIITSAGGIGAIVWVLVKSISKYVVDDINRNYQLQLDKELEQYKQELDLSKTVKSSVVESKQYITKTKFDIELQVYRELSQRFMEMVKCCRFLFTDEHYYFDDKYGKEFWIKKSLDAIEAVDSAQTVLYENAAFIPEEMYDEYCDILTRCQDIVLALEPLAPKSAIPWEEKDKLEYTQALSITTQEILDKFDSLNNKLRMYLNHLDII